MIVAYMKRHGANIVPAAAVAIGNISDEDHQRRVTEKFLGIQKGLREEGILDSQNKRVLPKVVGEVEEAGGGVVAALAVKGEAQEKRNKKATLASRAKGVCDLHWIPDQQLIMKSLETRSQEQETEESCERLQIPR